MTSPNPTHKHPVLLFPLRLETLFHDGDLLIRIYPDDVLVHAHDERLSPAESLALHQYVAALRNAGGEGDYSAAWRGLVERLGRHRAAYLVGFSDALSEYIAATEEIDGEGNESAARRDLVEEVGPVRATELLGISGPDPVGTGGESHGGVPRACLLPECYVAYLYGADGKFDRAVEWTARLEERRELPLLADSEEVVGEEALLYADQAAWIADFVAAQDAGMAVTIPDARDRYSRLIVIGLNGDDAERGGDDLRSLLEAHRFSSGVALVPYGTPTNNTAEVRSGYADDEEEADLSYEIETRSQDIDSLTAGEQLEKALGLTSASLQNLAHASDAADSLGKAARTLLWPALGDYFLKHMLPDPLRDDRIRLWEYFRQFVDARGPLPSIRVGKQPYGVVPVTGIREWMPSEVDSGASSGMVYGDQFEKTLHKILRELFQRWLDIATNKPDLVPRIGQLNDPDQELLEVLAMQPASVEVHLRAMVDDRFMGWIFPGQGEPEKNEEYIKQTTPIGCGTLQDCTQWWVDRYRATHRETEALLEHLDAAVGGVSSKLNQAKILDVYAWPDESSALEELEIPLVADSVTDEDPLGLGYIKAFGNGARAQASNKPLLYDLLRRSILYVGSPIAGGASSDHANLFNQALETFAQSSVIDLERAVCDVLELHTHRLDAWITSLATRRLNGMREAGTGAPSGICTGAYGWVEDLQREELVTADKAGGYIHAPSCAQAAAAAVLRNGYLSHADDNDDIGNACRINLSSERVRRGWRLLQGIREGQELGALLGYQFERGLHDAENDRYIDEFRRLYPVTVHREPEPVPGVATECVAARNVVDGLSLARDWMEYHEGEGTTDSQKRALREKWKAALLNSGEGDALLELPDDAEERAVNNQLDRLSDSLDAVFDLLMYEAVYQQMQGNYERSAAALDAMEGEGLPPEPESIQTPLSGAAFTQRVCVLLQAANGGWGEPSAVQTRATAEPTLAGWFAEILGDTDEIGCLARVTTYRNDAGEAYRPLDLNAATLDELNALSPIRERESLARAIVADRTANGLFTSIMDMVLRVLDGNDEVVKLLQGAVTVTDSQVVRIMDLDIDPIDFLYLCASIPESLLSSLGFSQPSDEDRRAGETELEARIKYHVRGKNWLDPNCEVAIDFGYQAAGFSRSFAEAIEVSRSVLALFAGGRYLKPVLLSRPEESDESGDVQTFAKRDYWELRRRLKRAFHYLRKLDPGDYFAISRFGIEGAIPPSPVKDPEQKSRRSAIKKAIRRRLTECRHYRREAHGFFKPDDDRPPDYDKAVEMLVKAMKALFGGEFIVLPTLSAPSKQLRFDEKALLIEDEQRIHLWLQQVAQTHPAVGKLEDTLLATDAWQTPALTKHRDWSSLAEKFAVAPSKRLRVAQFSDGDIPYWLALSDAEIKELIPAEKLEEVRAEIVKYGWPRGALSLACWVPRPIELRKKLTGFFIDEWNELIPSAKRATGLSFQYDGPNAQAPQALLLAVPSTNPGDGEIQWSPEELREIVNDTLDLAKVRAVDLDALDETIGGLFPATLVPSDGDNPDWERKGTRGFADAVKATLKMVLTGEISVQIKNEAGKALSGIGVGVSGAEGPNLTTDKHGAVTFEDVSVGTHTISATHSSYKQRSVSVNVCFSQKQAVTLRLSLLPGTIKGEITAVYIRHVPPRPARGVQVTLTNSTTGASRTAGSGSDGSYQFSELMPGPYNVKAEFMPGRSEGCKTDSRNVILGEGGVVKTVNLGLDCVPDLGRPKGGDGSDRKIL